MVKELIVHLGDTKTGSTSIQKALVTKAYEVPGTELFYPTKNHHIALAKTLTRKPRFKQREARFKRVGQALMDSKADYGIISAEHFQFVDPEIFAAEVQKNWPKMQKNMRLVAYVRPHPDKLLSSFSERVKLGNAMGSFASFVDTISENKGFDYLPRFRKWREVFGDRFTLRPFVRSELHQQDAVSDFFQFVLGHDNFSIADGIVANTSLTVPQLALLREVHKTFRDKVKAKGKKKTPVVNEACGALGRTTSERIRDSGLGQDGAKFKIPARLADQIRDRYAADAAALDAEFFSGTPMASALEKIDTKTTRKRQSLTASEYFPEETLVSFRLFSSILTDMLLEHPAKFTKLAARSRTMLAAEKAKPKQGA